MVGYIPGPCSPVPLTPVIVVNGVGAAAPVPSNQATRSSPIPIDPLTCANRIGVIGLVPKVSVVLVLTGKSSIVPIVTAGPFCGEGSALVK